MAEVTYYWDARYIGWNILPDNMIDGNLATFASTATDDRRQYLHQTTCPGTDLGTITKVELRVYGYGDGNDRIDLSFDIAQIIEYQTTPGAGSPGTWGAYVDVTNDPIVDGWTWAAIADLYTEKGHYLFIEFDKVGKGNTMYCAKVEIRVTYTPAVAVPRHGFVNFQDPGIV